MVRSEWWGVASGERSRDSLVPGKISIASGRDGAPSAAVRAERWNERGYAPNPGTADATGGQGGNGAMAGGPEITNE